MKTRMFALIANSLVLLALVVTPLATPVIASPQATFTVTASNDVVDATPGDGVCETQAGNGMCTLRAAIMEANAHIGEDIIELPPATYNLTISGADEDLGATGDLDITESVIITGTGHIDTVIDATFLNDRVIHILPAADHVTIAGVKIQGGLVLNSSGGGIVNYADLTLEDVYFYLNRATINGGAIYNQNKLHMKNVTVYKNSATMEGGGIYTNSSIFADDIYIGYNTSDSDGGGLYVSAFANVELISADINHNTAGNNGGNLYVSGELTVEDSMVREGEAATAGGGLFLFDNATAILTDVRFSDNHAATGGGIWMGESGTVTGSDLLFSSNSTDGLGGAINNVKGNVQLNQSVFRENEAASGGAIAALLGSTMLSESQIISNTASTYGGGILNNGNVSLKASTLNENRAEKGGGIHNSSSVVIENSTISGNRANDDGGGVYDSGGVQISIYNSTITGNLAGADIINPGGEGGGVYAADMHVYFRNTILSGNHRRVLLNFVDDDCVGTLQSGDYNLIGTLDGCSLENTAENDLIGADPLLGELADNGGPTQTHALLEGSPAIDGGYPEGCLGIEDALLTSDQRGVARPLDGDRDGTPRCDIGAYELSHNVSMYLPLLIK